MKRLTDEELSRLRTETAEQVHALVVVDSICMFVICVIYLGCVFCLAWLISTYLF